MSAMDDLERQISSMPIEMQETAIAFLTLCRRKSPEVGEKTAKTVLRAMKWIMTEKECSMEGPDTVQ